MQTSSLFSLDLKDLGKGLLVAIGGAVLTAIETYLKPGTPSFDWKTISGVAVAAGLSYLGKNFFTPSKTVNPAD